MKRVVVVSPLKADNDMDVLRNIQRAQKLCRLATLWGVAAFASHAFYPLFLDDFDPEQRKKGMEAGLSWLGVAQELWVWTKNGITSGMRAEIDFAHARGIAVVYDPAIWADVQNCAHEEG
jgi:hypothetical protein